LKKNLILKILLIKLIIPIMIGEFKFFIQRSRQKFFEMKSLFSQIEREFFF